MMVVVLAYLHTNARRHLIFPHFLFEIERDCWFLKIKAKITDGEEK